VTEQDHRGEAVRGQVEVQEWVDLAGEEWVAPEPVQAHVENAFVLSAGLLFLMRSESPVPIRIAPSAGQRW
jgi:hypothetical protein